MGKYCFNVDTDVDLSYIKLGIVWIPYFMYTDVCCNELSWQVKGLLEQFFRFVQETEEAG